MLKQSIANVYRHEIERDMKEEEITSAKDLLDHIFGTYNNDYRGHYTIKRSVSYSKMYKRSLMQRINTLWVYPLFIITAPFRYVLFGQAQFNEDSKCGAIIRYLTGELR